MPPAASLRLPPAKRQTTGESVTASLRTAILSGALKPGERLAQARVATELGVSQAPVREAFAALEREGLVERRVQSGASVTTLSTEDIEEITSLRTSLEVLGVRLAVQRATDEDFARLEAIIRATDREHSPREAAALDLEFHEAVMHAARHKRLLGCWQTLHAQLKLALVQQGMVNPEFGHEVAASHRQLLAELRARNERGAVKIIEDQMEGFRKCARRLTGTESSSP